MPAAFRRSVQAPLGKSVLSGQPKKCARRLRQAHF